MDNISLDSIKKITHNIVEKHGQNEHLANKLIRWLELLMNGSESIDNKEDVLDHLKEILKEIEVDQ